MRAVTAGDIPALLKLDISYAAGERVLALERSGTAPELSFSLRWRDGTRRELLYDELTEDGLRRALTEKTDLFLVAELDGELAGYLMVVLPRWTDAGEITDLAVHRPARRRGAGRALVGAAILWARDRGLRGVWVEPRADNADAIDFYLSLGFRISGLNDRWTSNADDEAGRTTIYMYRELR